MSVIPAKQEVKIGVLKSKGGPSKKHETLLKNN
jgi:hypothetical protein